MGLRHGQGSRLRAARECILWVLVAAHHESKDTGIANPSPAGCVLCGLWVACSLVLGDDHGDHDDGDVYNDLYVENGVDALCTAWCTLGMESAALQSAASVDFHPSEWLAIPSALLCQCISHVHIPQA